MSVEPDNIIQNANDSGVSTEGERSVVVNGAIDFGNDVDLYQFQANAGEDVILDLDANEFGSSLDGRLRLFDSLGNEIGNNDDRPAPGEVSSVDAFLSFTPSSSANYYVGVSSVGNSDYDPNVVSDEVSTQAVVGEYVLEISLADETSSDADNTIAKAIATGLDDTGQSASFSDEIDNLADIDIYQVQLDPGEALLVDVDADAIGSDLLASDLRIFDGEGNNLSELAIIDDSRLSKDSSASPIGGDPDLTFIAESAGDYYIGVSGGGFDLPVYNPVNGIKSTESVVSGIYEIDFDIFEITPDDDPDNTIAEASATELNSSQESIVNGAIENGDDVDLYQIQLDAGSTVTFDLDTAESSRLNDLKLRLFDPEGNEVAIADDDSESADAPTLDPFLSFEVDATGDYYLGVGIFQNSEYDPVEGTTNLPQNREVGGIDFESTDYELSIDSTQTDIVVEPDPENPEQDKIIAGAIATGLDDIGSATFSNRIEPIEDVDLYRVQLDAGEGLILDVDAAELLPPEESASSFDSFLRLFDADGNEIATNDDGFASGEEFSLDSYLAFTANSSGNYYVGVSSTANIGYNPVTGDDVDAGDGSTGDYSLDIDIIEVVTVDEDPDNTIAEAIATGINSKGQSATFSQAIEPETDADLYQVQLDAGDNLLVDLDASELGSNLDGRLRLFDATGNELASVDDLAAPGEGDEAGLDSYLDFTAEVAGNYYVGVSDFINLQYDPNNGITNISQPAGNTTGNYDLTIEISLASAEPVFADFDRITGTNSPDVLSGNSDRTSIEALDGDDVVTGASNDDYLVGGAGSDILSGNKGNDTLIGGLGFDVLSGGEGDDFLQGDEDTNTLFGGAGADIFAIANKGNNTIVDFELDIDKIQLIGNVGFADLTIENIAGGLGVVVSSDSNISITTVPGITASNLSETDFLKG